MLGPNIDICRSAWQPVYTIYKIIPPFAEKIEFPRLSNPDHQLYQQSRRVYLQSMSLWQSYSYQFPHLSWYGLDSMSHSSSQHWQERKGNKFGRADGRCSTFPWSMARDTTCGEKIRCCVGRVATSGNGRLNTLWSFGARFWISTIIGRNLTDPFSMVSTSLPFYIPYSHLRRRIHRFCCCCPLLTDLRRQDGNNGKCVAI